MPQKRIDGKDDPEHKSLARRIREELLEGQEHIDFDERVDKGIQLGIFKLDEVIVSFRRDCRSKIQSESRKMREKDGSPTIIPVQGKANQGVLFEVRTHIDRTLNLIRRGLLTFGNHKVWKASATRMEEMGEEIIPVAEFEQGWAEILARLRAEAIALGENPSEIEVEDGDIDEAAD
jgi:hypothetical protein